VGSWYAVANQTPFMEDDSAPYVNHLFYRVIIYSFSAKGNLRRGTSGQMGERMLGTVKLLIIFADYVQRGWGPKEKRP